MHTAQTAPCSLGLQRLQTRSLHIQRIRRTSRVLLYPSYSLFYQSYFRKTHLLHHQAISILQSMYQQYRHPSQWYWLNKSLQTRSKMHILHSPQCLLSHSPLCCTTSNTFFLSYVTPFLLLLICL